MLYSANTGRYNMTFLLHEMHSLPRRWLLVIHRESNIQLTLKTCMENATFLVRKRQLVIAYNELVSKERSLVYHWRNNFYHLHSLYPRIDTVTFTPWIAPCRCQLFSYMIYCSQDCIAHEYSWNSDVLSVKQLINISHSYEKSTRNIPKGK